MARGKYEAPRKTRSSMIWILLILMAIGVTSGGVAAYLSASGGTVSNQFTAASHPAITVNADNSIDVDDPGYAVYLRAAVVINWKNASDSTIHGQMPVKGTDYTMSLGNGWKIIDGFYYYTAVIQTDTTTVPVVTVTPKTEKAGYQLEVTVIAQTVQAVGQTDADTPIDAVEDAWGITAAEITGS